MNFWRALDTVADLVALRGQAGSTGTMERSPERTAPSPSQLEVGLFGVVVGALKEAFERDRQRTDDERRAREEDVARQDRLLQRELQRQHGERVLGHARLVALVAAAGWLVSLVLLVAVWAVGGVESPWASWGRAVMVLGWMAAAGALAFTTSVHRVVTGRLARDEPLDLVRDATDRGLALAAWALVSAFALMSVALLLMV
jgi:hypothetical protein